jgi:hypothetical protein
LHPYYYFYIV